jgi:hypothetical protein
LLRVVAGLAHNAVEDAFRAGNRGLVTNNQHRAHAAQRVGAILAGRNVVLARDSLFVVQRSFCERPDLFCY